MACVTDAESYRGAQGRLLFVPPPLAPTGFVPDPPKPPPAPRELELEQLLARALEVQNDEQALLVVSDALMERGDPRGRLIAFMLEEEKQTELMRKVKINVIIRDHAASWTPPGARIRSHYRGLPDALEWVTRATDPRHFAWHAARSIHVAVERVPPASLFHEPLPRLLRLTGLTRAFLSHVGALPPENLETLDAVLDTDDLLGDLSGPLSRLSRLTHLTLRTAKYEHDPRLTVRHLRTFLTSVAESGLERVRFSLPRASFIDLQDCVSAAPRTQVTFLLSWPPERVENAVPCEIDVRRRAILVPRGAVRPADGERVLAFVRELIGEGLPLVET